MPEDFSWPLPPWVQLNAFLPPDEHQALLDWTLGSEEKFRPAKIINDAPAPGPKALVNTKERIALTTRKLGPLAPLLEQRMRDAFGTLQEAVGGSGSFSSVELELAAHGDGAHYRPHLDISYGPDRKPVGASEGEDRILSAVYYFYREPKGFTGGALRIHRFGAHPKTRPTGSSDYVDVEPLQNSLVAFPSWAVHEVRPVGCESGDFKDYRFALNCWFCRKLPQTNS